MSSATYKKIENIVLPKIKSFKEDLTISDRKMITESKSDFLYAYRESGTNIYFLDVNNFDYTKSVQQIEFRLNNILYSLSCTNKYFLYFDGDEVKEITELELKTIFYTFKMKVYSKKQFIDDINIEGITHDLHELMQKYRNWKSYVAESNKPTLRRLRNHFNFFKLTKVSDKQLLKQKLMGVLECGI